MNVTPTSMTDTRPPSEKWLWRLVTAGLVALAVGLVAVGFNLYV